MGRKIGIVTAFLVSNFIYGYAQDGALENIMMGARLLYQKGGKAYYMEVGEWEQKHIQDGVGDKDALKWANTGDRVLIATGSDVKVVDINSKDILYERDNLTINKSDNANVAAEISYDARFIYFVQGNNIKELDIEADNISTIFTTSGQNQIREGELCVSADGNRFVGRYSNGRAVFVDISENRQGTFANECSPAISPSGTRLAVNQGGHLEIATYTWDIGANQPDYWRNVSSSIGKWDNHTWSNHDDYYLGKGDPGDAKIVNVETEDCYNFGHNTSCNYPDLWIPESAGGIVPQGSATSSLVEASFSDSYVNKSTTGKYSIFSKASVRVSPDTKAIIFYSVTGQKIAVIRVQQRHQMQEVNVPKNNNAAGIAFVKEVH